MKNLVLVVLFSLSFATSVFAQQYQVFPGTGDEHWMAPVSAVGTLPATGNNVGDFRVETTAFNTYVWNGAAWACTSCAAGGGTVTSVSVAAANGFDGTVANATTTPAITIKTTVTGMTKGNGTALSAATSGTDYSAGTSALATGILKSTTATGVLSIAAAGTDYQAPISTSASVAHQFLTAFTAPNTFSRAQPACSDLSDGVASCSTDTTNAANISSGLLALARGGNHADLSATGGAHQVLRQSGAGADVTVSQLACSDLSNGVASCSTDTTNAANISSGLLALARGGTHADLSATGGVHQVVRQSGAGSDLTVSQIDFSDLSGSIAAAQMLALPQNDIYVGNAGNQPVAVATSGDLSNVAGAFTVNTVGTSTAANIHTAELFVNANTAANLIVAGPASGAAAPVTKRAMVLADIPSLQVNKDLHVNCARTDAYTADGSPSRPFKTNTAAIAQIIANADNAANPYTIINEPATCNETITLNNALLFNVNFTAPSGATINNPAATVIASTATNTNLATLTFNNFTINGGINLSGDINGSNFGSSQIVFTNCSHETGTQGITLFDVNNVSWYGGQIHGSTAYNFTNVAFAYVANIEGFKSGTTVNLVENGGLNEPAQTTGNYLLLSNTKTSATMTIDAGSEMDLIEDYVASTSTITNNGIIHSFKSSFNGTLTLNNGSSNRFRGDTMNAQPTVGATATITNQSDVYLSGLQMGQKATPNTPKANSDDLYFKNDDHLYSKNSAGTEVKIDTGGTVTNVTGTAPVVSSGGTTPAISMPAATNAVDGYLTAGDHASFAAAAGGGISSLTGPITATGPGAAATTINANVVANSMLAQMPTLTIKGNNTGGLANAADLTVAQTKTLLAYAFSDLSGSATQAQLPNMVVLAKVANYTLLTTDTYLTGSGTFNFTLPVATSTLKQPYTITNIGAGVLTILPNGADTIISIASITVNPGQSVDLYPDGVSNWNVR